MLNGILFIEDVATQVPPPRQHEGSAVFGADEPAGPSGYTLIQRLNEGALKEVFKARSRQTDELVALKCFKQLPPGELERIAAKEGTTVAGLIRRDAMPELLDHPHIPRTRCLEDETGKSWIEEELFDETLEQSVQSRGRPPTDELLEYARMLADVVDYLHRQSKVHGDIKMDNIGLRDGHLFLTDFGLATILSPSQTV